MSNSILFLFSIIIIIIHYFVESVLFLICSEYKIRKGENLSSMFRSDSGCASCKYLREPRQYLLVHHFRWCGTWLPSDGHSYFNIKIVIPILSIPYLPRIRNMEYNSISIPYSRFLNKPLIWSILFLICPE